MPLFMKKKFQKPNLRNSFSKLGVKISFPILALISSNVQKRLRPCLRLWYWRSALSPASKYPCPSMSGKGIASSLIKFATELAQKNSCRALRLDTGSQNIPALSLYQKNGFEIIASASKKVGDVIAHKNHLFLEKIL